MLGSPQSANGEVPYLEAQWFRAFFTHPAYISSHAMLRMDISSGKARTFNVNHCLIRGDLHFIAQTQALWLRCRFSKTSEYHGRVHIVPLQYTGGILCPVTACNAHVADYPSVSEVQPAFMYDANGMRVALSHAFLVKVLK